MQISSEGADDHKNPVASRMPHCGPMRGWCGACCAYSCIHAALQRNDEYGAARPGL